MKVSPFPYKMFGEIQPGDVFLFSKEGERQSINKIGDLYFKLVEHGDWNAACPEGDVYRFADDDIVIHLPHARIVAGDGNGEPVEFTT